MDHKIEIRLLARSGTGFEGDVRRKGVAKKCFVPKEK